MKFKLDWKISLITISSTLLLMFDYYYKLTPWKNVDRTILYFLIPVLLITLILRDNIRNFGFSLGDWKLGIKISLISIIIMVPILWLVVTTNTNMQDYYSFQVSGLPWNTLIDLFGWEFLFRGFLLFGYSRKFGPDAIWLQAVPFALAHLGKPAIETLSTIFGGFAFGWIAYKTKSFIYPLLIHWFIASITIIFASMVG
ncbi:type II CAAX prenyl endopeptidase Rce1 family protein [Chloroflexota bacterium]